MLAVQFLLVGKAGPWPKVLMGIAILAVVIMPLPALFDQGQPLLNNYVPILVHPVFIIALIALAASIAVMALTALPLVISVDTVEFATGCTAFTYLSACVCFVLAWLDLPSMSGLELTVERTVWGGGHVLQLVNTMMLMTVWLRLSQKAWGCLPVPAAVAKACFTALTVFALTAPLIYVISDADDLAHRQVFTRLLWIGIPLPTTVFILGMLKQIACRRLDRINALNSALILSLTVFALGGIAGYFLGVGDTRTPSHYHAVIGGVNLALMALFPLAILPRLNIAAPISHWSFILYGSGQVLHALGFFAAGLAGVPRKSASLSQGLDSVQKIVSMGLVGIGGTIAVIGGIWFIWSALKALLSPTNPAQAVESETCIPDDTQRNPLSLAVLVITVLLVGHWLSEPLTELSEPSILDRATFQIKLAEMIKTGRSEKTADGLTVIHPTGQDVYIAFRQWSIEPALKLDAGKSYRFHAMSLDIVHSITLLGTELLLQPNQESVLVKTIPDTPTVQIQCGEFCGNGHSRMSALIQVDQD
jgi:heme/copper-type cytochrome/quinol oxidase subunit 2